jgi:hypothetical protein
MATKRLPKTTPKKPSGSSAFGAATAKAIADIQEAEQRESDVTPEQERAADIAEKLSGTDKGREQLATILMGAVDRTAEALTAYLTKLEGYAEGIDVVTAGDGTEYKLITLSDLTGWRRREAWKLLFDMKRAFSVYSAEYDILTAAGEIAASDNGVRLLGLAYGPVGVPYDKERVAEYGAAVDDVLSTKKITGVALRFFSLSASSILTFSRNYLAGLVTPLVESLGATN